MELEYGQTMFRDVETGLRTVLGDFRVWWKLGKVPPWHEE
jgi:hypothetical protein